MDFVKREQSVLGVFTVTNRICPEGQQSVLGVFTVTNRICPEGQQSVLRCIYSDKPDLS